MSKRPHSTRSNKHRQAAEALDASARVLEVAKRALSSEAVYSVTEGGAYALQQEIGSMIDRITAMQARLLEGAWRVTPAPAANAANILLEMKDNGVVK